MAEPRMIKRPSEGVPPIIDTPAALAHAVKRLATGSGPIAIDAERASSYRYTARAYLIQVRRQEAGTFLIDPVTCGDMSELQKICENDPWIAHDASQDLPCLADEGLIPSSLFDTEIAAQMLGMQRFGLASVCEELLGITLAKEFSAVNWSARPIPQDWLVYAALDVEFLIPLYQELSRRLINTGKADWAMQEFEYVRTAPPKAEDPEPWRSLNGVGRAHTQRAIAMLKSLWECRDSIGRELDLSPSAIISNRNLVTLALSEPRNRRQIMRFDFMRQPLAKEHSKALTLAAVRVHEADPKTYPPIHSQTKSSRTPRTWKRLHPDAHSRLLAIRSVVAEIAEQNTISYQLMLPAAIQRKIAWSMNNIEEDLASAGARQWQIELLGQPLRQAINLL